MENDRHIWRAWADFLQQWGMKDIAASLLEAVGPLSLLGAQAFYMTQPFLRNSSAAPHLDALARLLDEPQQTRDFVDYLREVPSS
jgi:hypothetical protein